MTDEELLRMWTSGAGRHHDIPLLDTLRAIARAAAAEERAACAMECRVMAERYEAAGNDVAAMATLEIMDAIRSRSAAGGGPNG